MDPNYQGLRLPEATEPILIEHCTLMLDSFKKHNKLHYSYAHRIVNDMCTLLESGDTKVNEINVPADAQLIVRHSPRFSVLTLAQLLKKSFCRPLG
jgi:hypothetical protein